MDLSVLQTFIEVMREGSFAAVARQRNLDPSSISRAIAGLEEELGVRLFQRTTRRLSPTEAGLNYFERIRPLVKELQQANAIAADDSGQPTGELRLTTSVSFGLTCILPLLSDFQRQFPQLTVDLLLTDAIVDLLAERIDVAVRLGVLADSTLIAHHLMRAHYRVCASPAYLQRRGHPRHPADIKTHNCLLFPLAGFRSRWIFKDQQGKEVEVPVQGQTIISNALALQQCALQGMGITLLPHWLVDDYITAGTLINLFPNHAVTATDFSTSVWLVHPSRDYVPLKVRAFIEFMKGKFRKPELAKGRFPEKSSGNRPTQ